MRSSRAASVQSRPSEVTARSLKLREYLRRSGAMASSRSALSCMDATSQDFMVVEVGEGKRPTFTEQVIARLEQHGLRRCILAGSDVAECQVATCVDTSKDYDEDRNDARPGLSREFSHDSAAGQTRREPYFYLCVPCETRLTTIATEPATQTMLEDLHHHFSSAAHREAASWMADPDIDVTLATSPLIEDPTAYTRIYVNGVPVLLSRCPGGGDMFYPLPHEAERVKVTRVVRRAPVTADHLRRTADRNRHDDDDDDTAANMKAPLFPSQRFSNDANYWYQPLTEFSPGAKQVISLCRASVHVRNPVPKNFTLRQSTTRRAMQVDRVPTEEYLRHTALDKERVPLHPCVFALERRRLPKAFTAAGERKRGRDGAMHVAGSRSYYVQPRDPYVEEDSFDPPTSGQPNRCLVEANGVYRIALVSRAEKTRLADESRATSIATASGAGGGGGPARGPTLTRALLSRLGTTMPFGQYSTIATSMGSSRASSAPADGDNATADKRNDAAPREKGGGESHASFSVSSDSNSLPSSASTASLSDTSESDSSNDEG